MRSISPRRLAWIARCERRLWHDFHTDPATQVELTLEAQERAAAAEAHVVALSAAVANAATVAPGSFEDQIDATLELMAQGVPAIRGAVLDAELSPHLQLCGMIDLLLQRRSPSAFGDWSYAPVLIKLHAEPRREDLLQLDACRHLVAVAQETVPVGELWLGQCGAKPQRCITSSRKLDGFVRAWQRLAALADQSGPPALWFERSCIFCPWRDACQQTSQATGDLALLPGLGRASAQKLYAAGITSLTELASQTPQQLTNIGEGYGQLAALPLRARALIEGQAIPLEPQGAQLPAPALCFDVEAHPTTHEPWALGWATGIDTAAIALIAPERAGTPPPKVEGVRMILVESLAAAFQALADNIYAEGAIVHWGEYERSLVQRRAPDPIKAALLPRLHDAHRLLLANYALPLPRTPTHQSGSLKVVGNWLGTRWPAGADHWRSAWRAFEQWQASNAASDLAPVAQYLGTDLRVLFQVYSWLHEQRNSTTL